jgi:hypothetical protein
VKKNKTPSGKATIKKANKKYRSTPHGKKMRSLQSSRRHQGLKNNPAYRERVNKNKRIWTKKSGPAQDHRKEQATGYSKGYRNDRSKKPIIQNIYKKYNHSEKGQENYDRYEQNYWISNPVGH